MNTLIIQKSINGLNKIPRWAVALIVSVLPILVTILLVRFYLNANILNFAPLGWTDEIWYWHQTLSFSKVGFASGYYVVNEAVAPLAFFKFSSSGPLFPVIFGLIGHFVGWGWLTGIALNMLLLTLATLLFVYLAQLDKLQILLTGIVLLVCGPVMIFLPTNSQEAFHQAGAIILAGLFYRLWQGKVSRRLWWMGLLFLLLISLIRFSSAIFLPPYFLISERKPPIRRVIYAFVVGGLLAVGVYLAVSSTTSPRTNAVIERMDFLRTSPWVALQVLFDKMVDNLNGSFIAVGTIQKITADHVQGIQIAIILISALVFAFPARNFRSQTHDKPLENGFHLYNLGIIILLSVFTYLAGGFYRIFGVHVLLSLLLLIAFRRLATVSIIIAISILLIGTLTVPYQTYVKNNVTQEHQSIEVSREKWAAWLQYQPDADPWCNTILFPIKLLNSRVFLVPAGIGITYYNNLHPTAENPIHSHYLLLDQPALDGLKAGIIHLEQIAATQYGTIYRNLDAPCASNTQS